MVENNPVKVEFEPIGRRVEMPAGSTLLEAARKAGVAVLSVCGGIGICQDCRVRVLKGQLSELTFEENETFSPEELRSGYRLACQAQAFSDTLVDVPPDSLSGPQRLQLESMERTGEIAPRVRAVDFQLPDTSPAEADSLLQLINRQHGLSIQLHPDFPSDAALEDWLSAHGNTGRAVIRDGRLIALLATGSRLSGLAVDIGTTKIAFFVVDLESGEIICQAGISNPQIAYGEDVIARISYANQSSEHARLMHTLLIDALNNAVASAGIATENILDAVVVGNTAIHHFFAGLPVKQLGEAPYLPAVKSAMTLSARSLGLKIADAADVYLPPNIAGYVGADHISMLVDVDMQNAGDTLLALDIGTNTEISLKSNGRMFSCSCASGPAFEGARIDMGMRAAPGAIEKVQLIDGQLDYSTIDNQPPVGICGSGILDAVAAMRADGGIDARGVMQKVHPRVAEREHKKRCYILVPADEKTGQQEVYVTRRDVNEIQLAKGAIRAGLEVLLLEAGITASQIDRFLVAGAFGTYIDLRSAMAVGMFPRLPLDRFQQVGNAAGAGARHMLLSTRLRGTAESLASESNYVELHNYGKFVDLFTAAMSL